MQKIKISFFILFLSLFGVNAKPIVSVSIPPQAYFLKQIAGDTLMINTLIPQNIDPHTFEFKPSDLYKLQKSDLYLTIGLEFEEIWLNKLKDNLTHTKILPITKNIPFLESDHHEEHQEDHQHEKEHHSDEEEHHSHDPHIWLSPALVKILATNIASILSEHFPENKKLYAKNLQNFISNINILQETIKNKLSSLQNRTFLVYHSAWTYFAEEFNLKELSIQVQDKEPTPYELAQTIQKAKEEKIRTIFIQNGFSSQSISMIAESCGATTWVSNPLAYEWEKELLNFTQGLLR